MLILQGSISLTWVDLSLIWVWVISLFDLAVLYNQGFETIPFILGVCQLCLEYLLAEFKASAHSADMCPNVKAGLACPSEQLGGSIAGKCVVSVLWKNGKFYSTKHTVFRATCIVGGRIAVLSSLALWYTPNHIINCSMTQHHD